MGAGCCRFKSCHPDQRNAASLWRFWSFRTRGRVARRRVGPSGLAGMPLVAAITKLPAVSDELSATRDGCLSGCEAPGIVRSCSGGICLAQPEAHDRYDIVEGATVPALSGVRRAAPRVRRRGRLLVVKGSHRGPLAAPPPQPWSRAARRTRPPCQQQNDLAHGDTPPGPNSRPDPISQSSCWSRRAPS